MSDRGGRPAKLKHMNAKRFRRIKKRLSIADARLGSAYSRLVEAIQLYPTFTRDDMAIACELQQIKDEIRETWSRLVLLTDLLGMDWKAETKERHGLV